MSAAAVNRPTPVGLRYKVERVTQVRVLMVTLLFGSAVVLNLDDLSVLTEPTYVVVSLLVGLTVVVAGLSALGVRFVSDLRPLALAQSVGDALLAGGLVLVTGGPDSAFLFLFFLSIITASFVVGREGALFSASACSVVYAVVVLSQHGHVPGLTVLSLIFAPVGRVASWVSIVHLVSFYAVALLAGNLAERLGQVGSELEKQRVDVQTLQALNENIVNSVAGGLCTLDLAGRVIAFNPAAERITGYVRGRVLGRAIGEVMPPLAETLGEQSKDGASADGVPERRSGSFARVGASSVGHSVVIDRVDGQRRFLDLAVAPLFDALGRHNGHILSFSDVTELRQLQDVLQRQRRLAAIGQLSAAIAHEIRNPLASISGSIEVLRDAERIGDVERRLVDIAVREIDRLNELIADFLSYARPRELSKRPIDVRTLIEECVLLAQQDTRLSAGVTYVTDLPAESVELVAYGDPDSLREVLWNLVRNATEALDGRGTVSLRAKPAGFTLSGGVAICVRDDGPGLSNEARHRLFEPFFTTKSGGTGLGLAMVHRAVEAHGGLIWAEDADEESSGTAFWLVLPGAEASAKERLKPEHVENLLAPESLHDMKAINTGHDPMTTAEHLAPSLDELLDAIGASTEVDAVDSLE